MPGWGRAAIRPNGLVCQAPLKGVSNTWHVFRFVGSTMAYALSASDVQYDVPPRPLTMQRSEPFRRHARSGGEPALDRPRVLVVEPAPVLRHMIAHALTVQGYALATTAGLCDIDRVLAEFDPQLVISELNLPDGSGESVCRAVRRRGGAHLPVVLMSDRPHTELERRARAVEADRHVCKSRGLGALLDLVDAMSGELPRA
jgi:CheY-like chemotaxis protein